MALKTSEKRRCFSASALALDSRAAFATSSIKACSISSVGSSIDVSGMLTVHRKGKLFEMNFPMNEQHEIPVTDDMERAFGVRPIKAVLGVGLICVFAQEEHVRKMCPNQSKLLELSGRIQNATAKGRDVDCVSRSFCPKLSIPEDLVCGSAHCQIAAYWAGLLGKETIDAYQASSRGGNLHCEILSNRRINISGEAVLVAVSDILAELT